MCLNGQGDQASIIGGAINYVKELEQLLQSLEVQKRLKQRSDATELAPPFAGFFTFPQYSTCSSGSNSNNSSSTTHSNSSSNNNNIANEVMAKSRSAMADIEVAMVESHANLKVLSKRRPNQLPKMVVGLQNTGLTTLHLNVTTVDQLVLYSFSLKVPWGCASFLFPFPRGPHSTLLCFYMNLEFERDGLVIGRWKMIANSLQWMRLQLQCIKCLGGSKRRLISIKKKKEKTSA